MRSIKIKGKPNNSILEKIKLYDGECVTLGITCGSCPINPELLGRDCHHELSFKLAKHLLHRKENQHLRSLRNY